MHISSVFSLCADEKNFLIQKRIRLLELIEKFGSLSKAAKEVPMSYKAAWDAVDAMNNLSDFPLVTSETGGTKGGGSSLSVHGKELVRTYYILQEKYYQFIATLNENICDCGSLETIQRISMKLSARNKLCGEVK